jgi:hypothetical protein
MKRETNANAEGSRETAAPTNAVGPWLCSARAEFSSPMNLAQTTLRVASPQVGVLSCGDVAGTGLKRDERNSGRRTYRKSPARTGHAKLGSK